MRNNGHYFQSSDIRLSDLILFSLASIIASGYILFLYDGKYSFVTLAFIVLWPLLLAPIFLLKDLFNPFNLYFVYWQFLFAYHMLDAHTNVGFLRYGSLSLNDYDFAFINAIIVIILWYLFLYFGYMIAGRKGSHTSSKTLEIKLKHPLKIAYLLLIISILSFLAILFLRGGISGLIAGLSARTSTYAGVSYYIYLISVSAISAIIFLRQGYKKTSIFLIILSFVMMALFGGRSRAFFGTIFAYMICYHYLIKNLKVKHLLSMGIAASIFAIGTGNYRMYQQFKVDFSGVSNLLSDLAHATQGGHTLPALIGGLLKGQFDYLYGSTMFNIFFAPIPRSFWQNKPVIDETGIVGKTLMGANSWGLPPGPYGISFYNFGFIGVIIVAFVTGIIIHKLYRGLVLNKKCQDKNSLNIILYSFIITKAFNIISTSDQMEILWVLGVFLFMKIADECFELIAKRRARDMTSVGSNQKYGLGDV